MLTSEAAVTEGDRDETISRLTVNAIPHSRGAKFAVLQVTQRNGRLVRRLYTPKTTPKPLGVYARPKLPGRIQPPPKFRTFQATHAFFAIVP